VFSFGSLSRYSWSAVPSIHFIVNSGHVKLEGVVDNQADKDAAGIRANGVPGVFSVQNRLIVASNEKK
jgi:hyperosmotically inducible protein